MIAKLISLARSSMVSQEGGCFHMLCVPNAYDLNHSVLIGSHFLMKCVFGLLDVVSAQSSQLYDVWILTWRYGTCEWLEWRRVRSTNTPQGEEGRWRAPDVFSKSLAMVGQSTIGGSASQPACLWRNAHSTILGTDSSSLHCCVGILWDSSLDLNCGINVSDFTATYMEMQRVITTCGTQRISWIT